MRGVGAVDPRCEAKFLLHLGVDQVHDGAVDEEEEVGGEGAALSDACGSLVFLASFAARCYCEARVFVQGVDHLDVHGVEAEANQCAVKTGM